MLQTMRWFLIRLKLNCSCFKLVNLNKSDERTKRNLVDITNAVHTERGKVVLYKGAYILHVSATRATIVQRVIKSVVHTTQVGITFISARLVFIKLV